MNAPSKNSSFSDLRNAVFEHLHGRRCKFDGVPGKLRLERRCAIYPYEHEVVQLMHVPSEESGYAYLTDLTNSLKIFSLAKKTGFDFSAWDYRP